MYTTDSLYLNSSARQHRIQAHGDQALRFHRSLPGYSATPLIELPEIASELGVGRVFVKDESSRLGLHAFKVLGASYAIAQALSKRWGFDRVLSLEELQGAAKAQAPVTLFCATDGNHGRAVARTSAMIGLPCQVFIPDSLTTEAKAAIAAEGAVVREFSASYDDVVAEMRAATASQAEHALAIQDTAWPGYHEIPNWIVEGYGTMLQELDAQLASAQLEAADLVLAPAGVGSLAQAIVSHFRGVEKPPVVTVVEPVAAPTIFHALRIGRPEAIETEHTVMLGLNCGTPSELAWPVLQAGVDSAVLVNDDEARASVRTLQAAGVDAGPCGASTLAGARRIVAAARDELGIDEHSVVVLFNTESLEANPI